MAYSGSVFGIPYHQGSWLGLPDFGLTEKAASGLTGGATTDLSRAVTLNYTPQLFNPYISSGNVPTPQGQVLGTQAPTGGSRPTPSGGTIPSGNQPSGPNPQDQLSAELDQIFDPVFASLQGQENTLNQNYAPVEGQIQAQGALSQV